jgi:hypothetical protein
MPAAAGLDRASSVALFSEANNLATEIVMPLQPD